jgi:hypothetical protein
MSRRPHFAALLLVLLALIGRPARAAGDAGLKPGSPAPTFRLPDLENRPRALADFRGRTLVVWCFCGCSWCADCAHAWAQMQRGGVLAEAIAEAGTRTPQTPLTLVVFSGGRDEASAFARESLLDPHQTVFLSDADMKVTLDAFHAAECPRAFVIDGKRMVRYTNNHPNEDLPRKATAEAIVAHVITALHDTRPVAQLRVTGDIRSGIAFSPTRLDFGNVPAEARPALTLTAALDTRLAGDGPLPPLVSSNPAIRVQPLSNPVAPAAGHPGTKAGGKTVTRAYRITLDGSVQLGQITGLLTFQPAAIRTSGGRAVSVESRRAFALSRASVFVTGKVILPTHHSPFTPRSH